MAGPQGLDYQLAAVKFTEGLDTRTQAKLVVPGKWNTLDNLSMSKDQTPHRRDGVTSLIAGRTGNSLATYGNQLLAITGGDLYSVSTATAAADQASGKVGYVGIAKKEIQRSVGMQDSCDVAIGSVDGTVAKNLACYVWRDKTSGAVATGINVALFDEATGTVLIPNTQIKAVATAFCPRVVFCPAAMAVGGTFFIFYMSGAATNVLCCRAVTTAAPTTVGAEVALITDANLAALNFDVCAFGLQTNGTDTAAMVSYGWADGTISTRSIKVGLTAGAPAIQAGPTNLTTELNLPIASLCGITCIPVTSSLAATFTLCFAGSPYTGVEGITIGTNWSVVNRGNVHNVGPVVNNPCHITATANAGGTSITLFHDDRSSWASAANNFMYRVVCSAAMAQTDIGGGLYSADFAGAATDPAGPRGPYIAGKAFTSGNHVFLPVEVLENYQGLAATKANNNQQSTFFLYDFGTNGVQSSPRADCVAHALYGAVGVATINNNAPTVCSPCSTPSVGDGSFAYATTERTLLSFVGGFNVSPTGVVRLSLTPNTTQATARAQLGESTYLAGGNLSDFDGVQVGEHPFLLFPEGINVELIAGGGGASVATFQIVCIFEIVDHAGQRHQSAPSLPVSVTSANALDSFKVRCPTLHVGQDGLLFDSTLYKCNIVAYITQANGLSFNRVGTTAAGSGGTANDPTVAYVTLPSITLASVAGMASNELLYNQPNQAATTLPNLSPPPNNAVWVHGGRLFFDQADQQGQGGYSQPYANNLGLQFNPSLSFAWPISGGTFKTGAELDEKVILFCSRKLYVIFGTGPNAAGNYSSYSDPQEIPSDVGCSDPRSVVRIPDGLIFKSQKGFYLLGRDLTVRYIGAGVAAFDSYTITSATMMENKQEVRFTISNSGTSGPQVLVYCYLDGGQWSTHSLLGPDPNVFPVVSYRDGLYWPTQGQFVGIDSYWGVETDWANKYDIFSGTPSPIVWTARTSFLHLADIGGFQRVRWLLLTSTAGTSAPISTQGWTVYLNDVYGVAAYSFTFGASNAGAGAALTEALDFRHKIERQKCKSIAFQFTDTPIDDGSAPASYLAAVDGIQALTLEVGLRRGTFKLPAAQGVS